VVDDDRSPHHSGRSGSLPWGDNVHEAPVARVGDMAFDLVLYQSRDAWNQERAQLLSPAQRQLPAIYLEHDPPQQHPVSTRHWADDGRTTVVHVTHFNALMWEHKESLVKVIEHGVKPLSDARYTGELPRGIVVVNNLGKRGRRLGADIHLAMSALVPLTLVGMGSADLGGQGEVANHELPGVMACHRFFFHPIRYTSLGLSLIEAMFVGLPIVGLATTELPTVIRNGVNGYVDTRPERLLEVMRQLIDEPALARQWGESARDTALARFSIDRFVDEWTDLFNQTVRPQ
jgi:hypothetical protein